MLDDRVEGGAGVRGRAEGDGLRGFFRPRTKDGSDEAARSSLRVAAVMT
ncbi:hypothetical protein [Dactylosporangium sp. NPDC000521]